MRNAQRGARGGAEGEAEGETDGKNIGLVGGMREGTGFDVMPNQDTKTSVTSE